MFSHLSATAWKGFGAIKPRPRKFLSGGSAASPPPPRGARAPSRSARPARYRTKACASRCRACLRPCPISKGRLAISITALAGTVVSALAVDGQVGATESVFAGRLRQTVITLHGVQAGARRTNYVVVLRNVDGARELPPKSELPNGAPLGKVSSSPITLETRPVLPGVDDPFAIDPERLLEDSETTPVDSRNLLRERR